MVSLSARYIDLDPKMILECASGLENSVDVAKRYGYSEEEWQALEAREDVTAALEAAKRELEASGVTFQNKAKLMADGLIKDVFQNALQRSAPLKDKVAALLAVSKLAGWDTGNQSVNTGPAFSISINLPTKTVQLTAAKAEAEGPKAVKVDPEDAKVRLEFKDGTDS